MCFTSGTTGDPKCALHSFNTTLYAVELLNHDMEVTEREVFLAFLPARLELGLHHAAAEHPGRRDAGVDGAL